MHCPKCGHGDLRKDGLAGSGRQRYGCKACGARTTNPEQTAATSTFSKKLPDARRYVITSAQNATPVHKAFLSSLLAYCKHVDAELVVIPFRYKNPTSFWSKSAQSVEWWDEALVPYLHHGRFNINANLVILADIKSQPTAVSPLSGLESITGQRSGVVGHPKVQLRTIPTPQSSLPKIMTTTGAVTRDDYSDTKTGKKGKFHHTFGAAVVEVQGDLFHLRQINATSDGTFIDLDIEATPDGCFEAPPIEALVMGDTHVDFVSADVVNATFLNDDAIVKVLKPKRLIWHDLLDFYSRNHHHCNDPFIAVAKQKSSMDDVGAEVWRACQFAQIHTPEGCESVFVPSNHTGALAKWLREADWRMDPSNAEFYLETALEMVRSATMTKTGADAIDPFGYWVKRHKVPAKVLVRGQSYRVKGVELGLHGDRGSNGSRGSVRGFSRIGTRSTIGHSHSPGIEEGCHQVGTSTQLVLEYNRGSPSSWLNTHEAIYANGKRSLINIIKGQWRL